MTTYFQRGISPELLLSQTINTMPYLLNEDGQGDQENPFNSLSPVRVLRAFAKAPSVPLDHFQYFRLCLSAHYLTCGTPVPTDVDNQIRHKLWPAQLPLETTLQMATFVLESRHWDFPVLSPRFVNGASGSPCETESISGHLGEWLTVAAGAYCALKPYSNPEAKQKQQDLFENIADEVRRHSEIFGSHWRGSDGLSCLKASAIIAHNFGDLDRVMDIWELSVGDPLRLHFYKLTGLPFDSNGKLRYLGRLWVAGELYKSPIEGSSMALENHRHFALRKPKCLRQSPHYLIPLGPFFDGWGKRVARALADSECKPTEQTFEIIAALRHGWDRTPQTVGYGRALRSILEVHPHLKIDGPARVPRWKEILAIEQVLFEKQWSEKAIELMDDIPSRAR